MNDRNRPKAFEGYSAEALGLQDLRVGIHEVCEGTGAISTTICVERIWTLRIIPFREQRGFITVASSENVNGIAEWRRAVLRVNGAQIVCDVPFDPVAEVLSNFDLISTPRSDMRDGISYELIVTTSATHATIGFSNPFIEPWRSLEAAALKLALQLFENCESETLSKFLTTWQRYCERPS